MKYRICSATTGVLMSLGALLVFSAFGCCNAVCDRPAAQGQVTESRGGPLAGLSLFSVFEYALLADPMVGTGGHGHTYPGATLPFGMVQLSPDTRLTGWDGCSAYHYSDDFIYGFSHTHLSGTGCSDYGDILFMPVVSGRDGAGDRPPLSNGSDGEGGYRSSFSHEREKALPGFYSVRLDSGIEVSLTATARCGFHRYAFPSGSGASVVVDLSHRDRVIDSGLYVTGDSEISGFRRSDAWAKDQHVYFVARFSRPIARHAISLGGVEEAGLREGSGEDVRGWFSFGSGGEDGVLLVKVGISAVSIEGAAKNLDAELPGWDFDDAARAAAGTWDRALGRIRVKGGTPAQRRTFYTSLYHSLLAPNIYSDVDGRYRGRDLEVHRSEGGDYYTVFSLWDTYRAAHPLLTIIEHERTSDLIRTLLLQYRQGGLLPVWELGANETGCMIGYHAVPVIADAWVKGIRDFDGDLALEAMKASATQDHLGLKYYRQYGFIPSEDAGQSVSRTLEYAYDDWCIARMAESLGKDVDRVEYLRRSQSYKNLFDPSTGFMRARVNGGWVDPFDPVEVNYHYTEANSWQYSFYVPQDVSGLAHLHGGMAALEAKLDSLFGHSGSLSGFEQPDVTGLIGQYAHGNEPSQHMAYLYNFTGSPWKTQLRVREIMDTMYSDRPDGLCGNEDCGQMSAWYVFSAMGFYPVTPGQDGYIIGTPLFDEVEISIGEGRTFTVAASGVSKENIYIQSATLRGRTLDRSWISHGEILSGGRLEFLMGPAPARSWGVLEGDVPVTRIDREVVCPAPFIDPPVRSFTGSLTLSLGCAEREAEIRYTLDGSDPGPGSTLYTGPFTITSATEVRSAAFLDGMLPSPVVRSMFAVIEGGISVELASEYSSMYSAGGALGLVDMIRGGVEFRTGGWQGYRGVDFEALVDLGGEREIRRISAGFLHDQGAWIFLPRDVEFAVSTGGDDFTVVASLENPLDDRQDRAEVWQAASGELGLKARFVRVRATTIGACPDWHPGAGNMAWIFVDEIEVE